MQILTNNKVVSNVLNSGHFAIEATHIDSANINAIGWRDDTLYIRFNSGKSYAYESTPECHFVNLKEAESAGRYFHQHIRSKFRYTLLELDPFIF